jgi:glycolate dehydrogenase FAD-binding subunit
MTALKALAKVCPDVREGLPEEGVLGVAPAIVATPDSVAETAEVMRVAAEHGLAVVPRGGETRLDWGRPPERCDLLLDTAGLDAVIEHAAGDLVVKVEAGLSMERLDEVVAAEGQQLALDLPLPGSTVGGTLATAACGPRRLQYGSPRDLLIGITVVRADGRVAKAGGKVVKNVAGYDLGKLFTGSYGTLGVIVEAAFRLHPRPAAQSYVTAEFGTPEQAGDAVQRVMHSPVAPAAVELAVDSAITVTVLAAGVEQGVPARAEQVAELLGMDAHSSAEPPPWWGRYPDGATLIEVSAPPTILPAVLAAGAGVQVRGSAAVGALQLGLDGEPEQVAALLDELRGQGVRAVVRYAPEPVRDTVDLWGPVPALALMRRVKDQFDPERRLSPGRFVGGI